MDRVQSPVIFVIFNRPDTTAQVFAEIARARPKKLLVIADGPRKNKAGEAEKCEKTRKIIDSVDWDCEVLTCFSDENLGCKRRLATGLTWAFEQVEEAIILEDDILPHPTFFRYCDELLSRYRADLSVMAINGTCFLDPASVPPESYYFSDFPLVWGWATWRRAWSKYDLEMKGWEGFRDSNEFKKRLPPLSARWSIRRQMNRIFRGEVDTWDYQWTYSIWKSNGFAITPTRNLIQNIGFGPNATHTHVYDPVFDPPVTEMKFPLAHPEDKRHSRTQLDVLWLSKHHNLISKISRHVKARLTRFVDLNGKTAEN